jgi:hypothetical protein
MGIRDGASLADSGRGASASRQWPLPARCAIIGTRDRWEQDMAQAKGEFEVRRNMEPACDMGDGVEAGHFRFDKQFSGPLQATSVVHMLAVGTPVDGSAGYVAIERLSGTLEGRSGSFFMLHNGVMDRGTPSLSLSVVPDSGSDGLAGLSGRMAIDIVDGKHYYTFDYGFDDAG